jgi:autotransporter strand-loop-strand O-heptosyltransferase
MIKVRAHTCYLGKTGYAAHSRSFFRELSKYVDLRIRNYTWDDNPNYLNEIDFGIIDKITLNDGGKDRDYPISHGLPNYNWLKSGKDFQQDVDIVLMDTDHYYFYEEYNSKVKIAYTVWESTELPQNFFNQLLKFDYLWVVSEWHKKVAIDQGYPKHRILIVNEGVNSEFFDNIEREIPEDYNDGRFKFLFFGRWDYRKAVPEIIDSFIKAFPNNEPVDLILSADNPFSVDGMKSTEERLEHYGYNDSRIKVKHFLSREDYILYIKKGNVLITCARSEGWNIPLIEAMAAGTPVIYSNWGAQLEFAHGKGNPVRVEKELPALIGANLGFAGKTPGLYGEPDYNHLIEVLRDCYENYEDKKSLAVRDSKEIIEKYNWENIGKNGYDTLKKISPVDLPKPYKDESVVILSHADNDEKIGILKRSIITLKNQGYFIILSSHILVPSDVLELVDYLVCETDNPIVNSDEYSLLSNTVPIHYMNYPDFNLVYSFDYNHGYAALRLILNGLIISKGLGYEITHFVNYDYIIDDKNLLEKHSKLLKEGYSIVSYKWDEQESINSGFFSGKSVDVLESIRSTNTKKDYFRYNGVVILEDFLYKAFEEKGINIFIENIDSIKKDNTLNSVVLQTYPYTTTKNQGNIYHYLCYENNTDKHFIFINSNEEDLEFNVIRGSNIIPLSYQKNSYFIYEVDKKDLEKEILLFFPKYNKLLKYNMFTKKASIDIKNKDLIKKLPNSDENKIYNISFIDGPKVEINNVGDKTFDVEFIDNKTNISHYKTTLKNNTWGRSSIKYYKDWIIRIKDNETGELIEERIDLKNKNVLISLESSSLGDSISWFPYVEEFQKKHECNLYVSTFKNNLFKENYPNIKFIEPGESVNDLYALYRIGWFYKEDKINYDSNPRDFKKIPMQATTTDILGLEHTSLKPRIVCNESERPIIEDYACIAIHSTAQAKYWNNPTGWQELTDWFNSQGIKVVMLSLEGDGYMGNNYPSGVIKIEEERTLESTIKYLRHCKIFVGIGSGLSWLSWALDIPTVIISGFSSPWTEPEDENILRIFNLDSCNSCFNRHRLDAGDWNWCPDQKGTERQFECSKSITGKHVIEKVDEFIYSSKKLYNIKKAVSESYKLGMVQNYSEIYEAAKFFESLDVKNFMEIGTDQGGTFAIWSKLSKSKDGIRISVDLPHGPYGRNTYDVNKRDSYLKSLGNNVTTIHGSSHEESIKDRVKNLLNGELLDFLFIDGDHTYEGVKKDYNMYKEFVKDGGWIGFHDTKNTEFHRNANCRVDILWNELEGKKMEFVDTSSDFGGIGFIQKNI